VGISAGPSGVSDGLVFQLDAANLRSYSGSGNTANGITNLQINHQIVAGGTTINADYIFYRKLGRLAQ
jgi:hypothetical protein